MEDYGTRQLAKGNRTTVDVKDQSLSRTIFAVHRRYNLDHSGSSPVSSSSMPVHVV